MTGHEADLGLRDTFSPFLLQNCVESASETILSGPAQCGAVPMTATGIYFADMGERQRRG